MTQAPFLMRMKNKIIGENTKQIFKGLLEVSGGVLLMVGSTALCFTSAYLGDFYATFLSLSTLTPSVLLGMGYIQDGVNDIKQARKNPKLNSRSNVTQSDDKQVVVQNPLKKFTNEQLIEEITNRLSSQVSMPKQETKDEIIKNKNLKTKPSQSQAPTVHQGASPEQKLANRSWLSYLPTFSFWTSAFRKHEDNSSTSSTLSPSLQK